jgi:hypothetical protein
MDFPIDKIATTIEDVASNWDAWMGYALAAIAGIDKLFLIVIKTMSNIRDAWHENFKK